MVANESLSSTRTEFAQAFQHAVDGVMPAAAETLLSKASASGISTSEQRRMVSARGTLQDRRDEIAKALQINMEQLLDRSLSTAYSTFRPASALEQNKELALLDSSTFESTLRFNEMTQNFRNRSEQLIIDLNIRIAVLFGQDDIRERENPFRPYLVSRCIFLAIEGLKLLPETEAILIEQLGESLSTAMSAVYQAANNALEKQGISAHLSLKITKAPEKPQARGAAPGFPPAAGQAAPGQGYSSMQTGIFPGVHPAAQVGVSTVGGFGGFGAPGASGQPQVMQNPGVRLEQLFQSVRGKSPAPAMAHGQAAVAMASPPSQGGQMPMTYSASLPPISMPSAAPVSPAPAWLQGATALGGALRRAFGEASAASAPLPGQADSDALPYQAATTAVTAGVAATTNLFQSAQSGNAGFNDREMVQVPAALLAAHLQNIESQLRQKIEPSAVPGASIALGKVLGQMHKVMAPESASMADEHGDIRNLLREQKDALYSLAQDSDEQMTVDIISMLFEFMLSDELVPLSMRVELGRLQFMILQLALKDKDFLTNEKHPARLLFNRICSVAFCAEQIDDVEPITEEISRIIKTLLRHDSEVPELFSRIQNRFETFITRELRTNQAPIRRTVKAIGEAEIRFMRFACIAAVMSKALSKLTVEASFRSFLRINWVAAIEIAERTDSIQARRYRLLVPDLLWSVYPKTDADDRNLLSSMLPVMLSTLRHGLELIGWEKAKQQKLMNWLAEAHSNALRGMTEGRAPQPISLPQMHERFEQFTNQADTIEHSEIQEHDFAREQFLVEVLAELSLPAKILDKELKKQSAMTEGFIAMEVSPEKSDKSDKSDKAQQEKYQDRIVSAAMLEFKTPQYRGRACIRWVNPNGSNVVLSMSGEEFPSVLSMPILCELLDQGKIRFVETEAMFERAIHSLIRSADAMDNEVS
ncbi:DUF1631 family protein [Undibacterium sp. CY18W]|uniref:DUF1631 family protein n=1 Tax=Undibacterium hunanense TaxID=2762292 RepID=A0ABR6ZYC0_9BURK|nr:DUF1631 family protein [Undibacterium hunanense]MBC3920882.1 DUF1631 family protein [Undibacterium hunanense]